MRSRALASALLAILAGCGSRDSGGLPYYGDASLEPRWYARAVDVPATLHRTGDFALTDQRGRRITAADLDGRVHVAQFFFSACGDVCPLVRRRLQQVAAAFCGEPRVVLVSFSVMDSTTTLARFGAAHGVDRSRWHLLWGDRADIARLARESYLVGLGRGADYGRDSVAHTEMLVLVDGERHVRGVYNGTLALDAEQLIADIRTLLAEPTRRYRGGPSRLRRWCRRGDSNPHSV